MQLVLITLGHVPWRIEWLQWWPKKISIFSILTDAQVSKGF